MLQSLQLSNRQSLLSMRNARISLLIGDSDSGEIGYQLASLVQRSVYPSNQGPHFLVRSLPAFFVQVLDEDSGSLQWACASSRVRPRATVTLRLLRKKCRTIR